MSAQPLEDVHDWLDGRPRGIGRGKVRGRPVPPRPSSQRTIMPDLSWQADAACAGVPAATSERFTDALNQTDGEALAATWCARCPVAALCLKVGRETWAWGLHGGVVLIDGRVAPASTEGLARAASTASVA